MIKLAVIGASYLQAPLITKAKERGIQTHVFAWAANDIGEKIADFFYPISIIEKEAILEKCREIQIDGICSIASDLAVRTVNYVAEEMGLTGNSMDSVELSTNKHNMRMCFERNGDPSPKSVQVSSVKDLDSVDLSFPVIVKPVDRSGSRGVTKVEEKQHLIEAIERAKMQGFEKVALVEEFVAGEEYSVEYVSWKGNHTFLALTQKYTTGSPDYIETGHMVPALISDELLNKVKLVVSHALTSLGIEYGASHTELKISADGDIKLIEIGARMGGDCIGSALVELSTGYDYVSAVIDIALGIEPIYQKGIDKCAAIHFVLSERDIECYEKMKHCSPEILLCEEIQRITNKKVSDSSSRFGYYLMRGEREKLLEYMPATRE